MADEKIVITISGNISADIATRIRDIGRAANESHNDLALLKQELRSFSAVAGFRQASSEVRKFKSELTSAGAETRKFATSLKQVDGATINLRKNTAGLGSSLSGLVGGFSAIFAVREWMQASDAMTNIQNKLRGLTSDIERQTTVQAQLFDVANRTRSGVEATTDGFVRFSKAMQDASDPEVLRFVETLNKSLLTAGRTSGEVNSIVVQLGQALTSGRLMGDEFRSLSENLPREALQAIADVLGTNVDNLKALSTEGQITTEVLREAFANMAAGVDEAFARTVPTIEQALTVLNNKWIAWTTNTQGMAGLVATAIMAIGDNLNIVVPLVALFLAAWGVSALVSVGASLIAITTAVVGMTAAMIPAAIATAALVLPWVALAAAILTAGAIILQLTGQWDNFNNVLSAALKPVEDMAKQALGMGESLAAGKPPGEALKTTLKGVASESKAAGTAVSDFASKTQSAASKVVAANDNITRSYQRMSAARAAANQSNYNALAKEPGGTKGSFTAVPKAPAAGSAKSSITTLPGYAQGGSFMVRGTPSGDRNVVRFRANAGERVTVQTRKQQREAATQRNEGGQAGPTFVFNVQTPDADSFRLSRNQMAAEMMASFTG